ncbi:MAG: tRNA uridine-5-carboxymethylaminomethyl(34) synthesis enzyme MnmG [Thermoanaerobaculales bacterium]|nr:tRNA uridine-5-carboxymethylaminomethyl(34) synthesis enzyme MnmG [Thermoanaerobaculales bacterium]
MGTKMDRWDVVVVGAGHAGIEAAMAGARMGASVAVVTLHLETIGQMPCNPSIGGIGKGHLVAEIDALGGVQGWAADRTGIHFRLLNASRGPAVWGPRAQCDKDRYATIMRRLLLGTRGIDLIEGEATDLVVGGKAVCGVVLADGRRLKAGAVVLTTGTFLGAVLHTGEDRRAGGRFGERPSIGMGRSWVGAGLELRRFKTGTPPRIHRDSVDFARLEEQVGDERPRGFSWRTTGVRNYTPCWVARTPPQVQAIIEENLERSPLFAGQIEGVGPRYCPSIEDKIVRFPHHKEHTVFVEPETRAGNSIYLNGLSTSLPEDVQVAVVRAVPGLERAQFLRYGYAVEYDVVAPRQVGFDLAAEAVPGLYLAGQLLGTSGYEEAAGLGLMAGINAAASVLGKEGARVDRTEGYIGVLIDDVVTRDHREPYRMFTSRAENRLMLGVDSARERLMVAGVRLGLVPERVFHVEQCRWEARRQAITQLEATQLNPNRETVEMVLGMTGVEVRSPTTWAGILRRQDIDIRRVGDTLSGLAHLAPEDREVVIGRLKYRGYIERQEREQSRLVRLRGVKIPAGFGFRSISGLSREIMEEMERTRPRTLSEAAQLAGMTPAALALVAGRLATRGQGGKP